VPVWSVPSATSTYTITTRRETSRRATAVARARIAQRRSERERTGSSTTCGSCPDTRTDGDLHIAHVRQAHSTLTALCHQERRAGEHASRRQDPPPHLLRDLRPGMMAPDQPLLPVFLAPPRQPQAACGPALAISGFRSGEQETAESRTRVACVRSRSRSRRSSPTSRPSCTPRARSGPRQRQHTRTVGRCCHRESRRQAARERLASPAGPSQASAETGTVWQKRAPGVRHDGAERGESWRALGSIPPPVGINKPTALRTFDRSAFDGLTCGPCAHGDIAFRSRQRQHTHRVERRRCAGRTSEVVPLRALSRRQLVTTTIAGAMEWTQGGRLARSRAHD